MRDIFRAAVCIALICLTLVLVPAFAPAAEPIQHSQGQVLYVPVYSHVYFGDKGRKINLAITLSIRNTDRENAVTLLSVKYHNSDGKLVHEYVEKQQNLPPLAAIRFLVAESDLKGGSGACFIVTWQARQKVSVPIVQGVMIGAEANQGISFLTQARVLEESEGAE